MKPRSRHRARNPVWACLLLCLPTMVVACLPAAGGPGAHVVRIDGSSTVYPITEAVVEEFQRLVPHARITVGRSGSTGGFQRLCRGEIDVANASRPIRSTESDDCTRRGVRFIELPVAYDGLTVAVHPRNHWARAMTTDELRRLWEPAAQGRITRWRQIRTDWPDREVHLFGAGVGSGTFDYFTAEIVGREGASRGDYTSSEDDNLLVQGVATNENALGYFGFAYYEENRQRLAAVAIDATGPGQPPDPVIPSRESIRSGRYWPLSRPVFIYVARASLDRPLVADLVTFYLQHAAALVEEVGYVALSSREYELARLRLDARATGSIFAGHHAPRGISLEMLLADARP